MKKKQDEEEVEMGSRNCPFPHRFTRTAALEAPPFGATDVGRHQYSLGGHFGQASSDKRGLAAFAVTAIALLLVCAPGIAQAACIGGSPNGVIETGEQCDDGNGSNNDLCKNDCTLNVCGDGYRNCGPDGICGNGDDVEVCDDGNHRNTDACPDDVANGGSCKNAVCGDGFVWVDHEGCDDGNTDNTDDCIITNKGGPAQPDAKAPSPNCAVHVCGDGFLHSRGTAPFEQCDDHNANNADDCLNTCKVATCGDSFVHTQGTGPFEQCDKGLSFCKTVPMATNPGALCRTDADCTGTCTSGSNTGGACRPSTQFADCGGGTCSMTNVGCNDAGNNDNGDCTTVCKTATCGDSFLHTNGTAPFEQCDDGNTNNSDTCIITNKTLPPQTDPTLPNPNCAFARCGDGFACNAASCTTGPGGKPEECDDGNLNNLDACTMSCSTAKCGDGYVQAINGEQCDSGQATCTGGINPGGKCKSKEDCPGTCPPGSPSAGASCTLSTSAQICGAGFQCGTTGGVAPGICGGGNVDDVADACRSTCRNAGCGDRTVDSGEQCDDGNTVNTDSCIIRGAVPTADATVEGNSNNIYPFDCAGFGLSSQRYQQVYLGSEVGTGKITQIAFRPDAFFGTAFGPVTIAGVSITLSSTTAAPDAMSLTYASNIGADVTTVFSGNLTLQSAAVGGPPRAFDIVVPLTTPFVFNAASGLNLLLDVTVPTCAVTTIFDAESTPDDSVSRASTSVAGSASSATADFVDTGGLVTRFVSSSSCAFAVCGDGFVLTNVEQCDDANTNDHDFCKNDCTLNVCGDGVQDCGPDGICGTTDDVEECDDGAANSDTTPDACRTNCVMPSCGDGVADAGEGCDDGNIDNTDACIITAKGGPPQPNGSLPNPNCAVASCGDGIVCSDPTCGALKEECDDGLAKHCISGPLAGQACQTNSGCPGSATDSSGNSCSRSQDGCSATCKVEFCGDGIQQVRLGEQCDDGNRGNGDGCDANCKIEHCGNGISNQVSENGLEECDDGGICAGGPNGGLKCPSIASVRGGVDCGSGVCTPVDGDGCNSQCEREFCGDGVINDSGAEKCDNGAANSDTAPNACRTTCVLPKCGDKVTDNAFGEQCDTGNVDTAACNGSLAHAPNACTLAACGDGILNTAAGEQCDDGAANNSNTTPDACRANCTLPRCGDLIVDPGHGENCEGSVDCTPSCCSQGQGSYRSGFQGAFCQTNGIARACGLSASFTPCTKATKVKKYYDKIVSKLTAAQLSASTGKLTSAARKEGSAFRAAQNVTEKLDVLCPEQVPCLMEQLDELNGILAELHANLLANNP